MAEKNFGEQRERATDMELADFLIGHIENPCEAEVSPGRFENIRNFYIREAKNAMESFTDEKARQKLQEKISQYEKNPKV